MHRSPRRILLSLLALVISTSTAPTPLQDALAHLAAHESRYREELLEFIRIPSVSSVPEHAEDVRRAAAWCEDRLRRAGVEHTEVLETGGHPVVYGDWLHAPGKPTVLLYAHFDVQPVDPLDQWEVPPFDGVFRGDRFVGRGAADDKGGLLQMVHGVEAYLATRGQLPINVKFLLEGQEEIGSPQLPAFLAEHATRFAADLALSGDGFQISPRQPGLLLGLRGAVAVQVDVTTAATDLHSGLYGGSVRNPLHALAELVASFHHPNGSVAVAGFYHGVEEPSVEERADMAVYAAATYDEAKEYEELGAEGPYGEVGFTTTERRFVRPTLDVVGMWGGFTGAGIKTVIPREAHAKVTCRLVPGQRPDTIITLLEQHCAKHAPAQARVAVQRLSFTAVPYAMEKDALGNRAAAAVLRRVMGGADPLWYKAGASIPAIALFQELLGVPTTLFSFSLTENRVHAPNEFHRESMYRLGRVAYAEVLEEIRIEAEKDPSGKWFPPPPWAKLEL